MKHSNQHLTKHILVHKAFLWALCFSFLAVGEAAASQLRISPLIVENNQYFLNITITKFAEHDIIEAIKRGIETKLKVTIQIVKENPLDFIYAKVEHTIEIYRSIKFDFWNRSYVITERGTKSTYHNERQMLIDFFSIQKVEIPRTKLAKGKHYRIRARAELSSIELYFPMNLIFKYIVGYWDFDTGWVNGPSLMIEQ